MEKKYMHLDQRNNQKKLLQNEELKLAYNPAFEKDLKRDFDYQRVSILTDSIA
jgi:hypothetical protein